MWMNKNLKQMVGFSIVGTTSFFVDIGLLWILVELVHMNPVIAAAISYIISLLYNYVLSMKYVFVHRPDISRKKELTIFMVLSLIGFGLNELCMWLGQQVCVMHNLDYTAHNRYMYVKISTDLLVGIWNFLSRKKWLDASSRH